MFQLSYGVEFIVFTNKTYEWRPGSRGVLFADNIQNWLKCMVYMDYN